VLAPGRLDLHEKDPTATTEDLFYMFLRYLWPKISTVYCSLEFVISYCLLHTVLNLRQLFYLLYGILNNALVIGMILNCNRVHFRCFNLLMRHPRDLDREVSQLCTLEKHSRGGFRWHGKLDETDSTTAFIPAEIDRTDLPAALKQLSHGLEI